MTLGTRTAGLAASVGVVLAAYAVVLGGALWNRSGEPSWNRALRLVCSEPTRRVASRHR